MGRSIRLLAVLGMLGLVAPAAAQDWPPWPPAPSINNLGQRFILMQLDQPDRDLRQNSTKVNVLFDTQTGRSWVLQYALQPGTNQPGYVWVEIPLDKVTR